MSKRTKRRLKPRFRRVFRVTQIISGDMKDANKLNLNIGDTFTVPGEYK